MATSSQEPSGASYGPIDEPYDFLKRAEQRLTLDNRRLSERYLNSGLHILIHIRIGGSDVEYVAGLKRSIPSVLSGEDEKLTSMAVAPGDSPLIFCRAAPLVGTNGRNQKPMLVEVIESMEGPESFSDAIASFVWFDRIDKFYSILPHTYHSSSLFGIVGRRLRRLGS